MSYPEWTDGPVVRPLVEELVTQILRQYRTDPQQARAWVLDVFAANRELATAAGKAASADQLRRTAAFKQASTAAKKHVYYSLRRYRPAESGQDAAPLRDFPAGSPPSELAAAALAVAAGHRSTAERLPTLDEFHAQLFARVGTPTTVLDIGCGVYPLVFPFDGAGASVTRYVAADKDAAAVEAVAAYAAARGDSRLAAVRTDLTRGWADLPADSPAVFDLAFLFKLVPVVERQLPELIPVLAETPAARWVVSGSRVALAKKRSIERRERATLEAFLARAGRRVTAEFTVGEEFCWVAE